MSGIDRLRLLMLVSACAGSAGAAETRSCRVSAMQGPASLVVAAQTKPLAANTVLAPNSRLTTGKGGWIDVLCNDKTRLTVGAETEIDLGTLIGASGPSTSVLVRIQSGIARFFAPVQSWSSFRVRGPAAVASVRQTQWIVEAPQGATNVFVVEGKVEVDAGSGGSLELAPGEGIDVNVAASDRGSQAAAEGRTRGLRLAAGPAGTLGERKAWSAERIEGAMQRLGPR